MAEVSRRVSRGGITVDCDDGAIPYGRRRNVLELETIGHAANGSSSAVDTSRLINRIRSASGVTTSALHKWRAWEVTTDGK